MTITLAVNRPVWLFAGRAVIALGGRKGSQSPTAATIAAGISSSGRLACGLEDDSAGDLDGVIGEPLIEPCQQCDIDR